PVPVSPRSSSYTSSSSTSWAFLSRPAPSDSDVMEFGDLLLGFSIAFTPTNLLFAVVGVLLGTIIGALPGIGPSAGVAVLLPVPFGMPPVTAMIMLAGIYYGAMYGGTITSVLINTPGESASVM